MSVSFTCEHCGAHMAAADEDQLVTQVEAHVGDRHPAWSPVSREQVIAHLHGQPHEDGRPSHSSSDQSSAAEGDEA